jgi:hypothetical protein
MRPSATKSSSVAPGLAILGSGLHVSTFGSFGTSGIIVAWPPQTGNSTNSNRSSTNYDAAFRYWSPDSSLLNNNRGRL